LPGACVYFQFIADNLFGEYIVQAPVFLASNILYIGAHGMVFYNRENKKQLFTYTLLFPLHEYSRFYGFLPQCHKNPICIMEKSKQANGSIIPCLGYRILF
jgi:hypothetical protein